MRLLGSRSTGEVNGAHYELLRSGTLAKDGEILRKQSERRAPVSSRTKDRDVGEPSMTTIARHYRRSLSIWWRLPASKASMSSSL